MGGQVCFPLSKVPLEGHIANEMDPVISSNRSSLGASVFPKMDVLMEKVQMAFQPPPPSFRFLEFFIVYFMKFMNMRKFAMIFLDWR